MNRRDEWLSLLGNWQVEQVCPSFEPKLHCLPEPPADPAEFVRLEAEAAGLTDFLAEAESENDPLTIAINDPHRFTDTRSALEAVCRASESRRIAPRFRLLVACGSHTFEHSGEMRAFESQALGSRAGQCAGIAWHNAFDASVLRPAGGVRLHAWIAESRFALGIGSMEPHYFAGATGAHKTLSVGAMAFEDLTANHRHALSSEATGLRLDGNPVFDGLAAAVRRMQAEGRRLFAINELLAEGRIAAVAAGDPLDCLRDSLDRLRQVFGRRADPPADLAVAMVDPPLDRDLYQADKGIKNVEHGVRDGGAIVLDAACAGGVGIDRFFRLLERAATLSEALAIVEREGYTLGDHKAVRLRALTEQRRVALAAVAPGLAPELAQAAGIEWLPDRAAAAHWAKGRLGPGGRRAILVSDAGNTTLFRE